MSLEFNFHRSACPLSYCEHAFYEYDFIFDLMFLWLCSGVSRSAGGDAGDHQTAGGGSVCRPPPQRPVRDRAARVTTDQRRAEEESGRIPAEDPEGVCV